MWFIELSEINAALMVVVKNRNVSRCLEVSELTLFELGLVMGISEFHILILDKVILALIQGHRGVRKQRLWHQLSLECWHAFRHLGTDLIQTWYDDRNYCTLLFDTDLIDLDLDPRSQECAKATISAPIISQNF